MEITILTGAQIKPYVNTVADFRMTHFKEFPYLYSATYEDEEHYLRGYVEEEQALLVLLQDNDNVVGILIGMPLSADSDVIRNEHVIFSEAGYDTNQFFYIGDNIIDPKYRGKEYFWKMLKLAEDQIIKWGYSQTCFFAIERDLNHPMRPNNYRDIASLYKRIGYNKTSLSITYEWPTYQLDGGVENMQNKLYFWVKSL